jgi:hypothetical protein
MQLPDDNSDRAAGLTASRRHFVAAGAMSLAPLAIAQLLRQDGLLAAPVKPPSAPPQYDLAPKAPPRLARATAMISLFMQGGPSQIDLFDPKPALDKLDGQSFPGEIKYDNAAEASAKVLASPWKFAPRGESGIEISELLPHLASVIDDIVLVRSMRTGVNNHGQSIDALNTGRSAGGRPTLGSWLTYGLGCQSQELPAYVALTDPDGVPVLGVRNWSNGWLPSLFQGSVVRPREPRILNLDSPPESRGVVQKNYLAYLDELNRRRLDERPGESELAARIANYALAARMQTAAREALDIAQESSATHRLYGLDNPATQEYGARCLIARRLVERGVRFVQVFTRNQFWDHHGAIRSALPAACQKVDQPAAALVRDLKQRGLLDSTVVHWGGEMGRLPVIQNDTGADRVGRDHNTYGFSSWFAGGGFKKGIAYGQTDEFGHQAVADIVHHYDYHATLLHLFGFSPEELTFLRNGRKESLLDGQPGKVVTGLLA